MKVYEDIMKHFGVRNQMRKLSEECYEFIESVDNYEDVMNFINNASERDKELAREFVIEEMGDMLILLTQFIAKYDIKKSELDYTMDAKLQRTVQRINTGYYDKF